MGFCEDSTGDDGELTLDTYKFYGNNRKLQVFIGIFIRILLEFYWDLGGFY